MTDELCAGDRVKIRVPNWRKVAGEWESAPTEHVVTVTAAFPEYIEFQGERWPDGAMVSRRQVVTKEARND